jgi:hypothetical protein
MTNLYFWLASLLFLAAIAAMLIAEPFAPGNNRHHHFALTASESDGRLRIDWDQSARAVLDADSAALDAVDGGVPQHYEVDRKILSQGGLEYRPRTEDVLLRLSLLRNGKVLSESAVRLTGSGPRPPTRPAER